MSDVYNQAKKAVDFYKALHRKKIETEQLMTQMNMKVEAIEQAKIQIMMLENELEDLLKDYEQT